ncbi:DUF2071 domain-containing protein [Stieleria sp. TO1_6]|uniref:YqjF family protein n=1 Tax=Stieleria tagensis TaxID=2956795 RepID=UPI00209B287C|nr:DUF2071 domain-containing protein [Stieleria tagensis]MCO8123160.1 DUF2071 domain-containing protein [Stieleria tagensis]
MIDRLAPRQRPSGPNDGTQRWESLLFCHWEIPVDKLRHLVPAELQLDTFAGKAYVGLVPFRMRQIRPKWLPRSLALNFLETNVRTYVIYRGRPGVYFFSLDANSRLAVTAARLGWALPYYQATMSFSDTDQQRSYLSYRRGGLARHQVTYQLGSPLGVAAEQTLEFFLLERYLLYVRRRGRIHCGQVHHSPYQISTATVSAIDPPLVTAAGLPDVAGIAPLAHFCPGVDVEVFGIQPV